ncbi:reticulon-4-interacting protein [Pochonia chlamydosporia 170]|uniref:Reticulon-4-interacting protein n=1 Tax=Pochonia chlamydosporia 170 TaxID=1380566 RepID=A0A179FDV1_METCM|nr:reticulon-4-interacting protein [Pochonia chlamydosporia 170]OAQ63672.1 reticulon-4-interacting protein [Pochonia chlamydosporia 170]
MRAVHQPDKHSPDLKLVETPVPKLSQPSEVLIKVAATAPCYSELTWVGQNPEFFPPDKEPVPGQDVSGTVVQADANSAFKPGDEVFCRIDATRPGGLREYTVALESELAIKPKSLDWISATATPLSALTAWQALFVNGSLESSALFDDAEARERNSKRKVLITAAGGSVGGFAIQLAAAAGAGAVVGVCSGDKAEQVYGLGASAVVDYKKQSIDSWVTESAADREFDLIVDCVGGDAMRAFFTAVKDGGEIISVSDFPDRMRPEGNNKKLKKSEFFIVKSLGSQLSEIGRLIEQGRIKALVDSVYDFDDFEAAFTKLDQRTAKGKIVIKVNV